MKVILYSNHCPCCAHLESALTDAGIPFELVTDTRLMLEKGFSSVPMLEADGQTITYPAALKWLRERTETHANHQV